MRKLAQVLIPLALVGGIALAVLRLTGSGSAASESVSGYTIINTGIKGGGCWYDDSHFVVVQGRQPSPAQEFEVEGLYYLDPRKPKELKRIDLAPIEPSIQKQIRDVSCQEQTILFDLLDRTNKTTRLYGMKIGQIPELIAEMRWATPHTVNLRGRYVLGNKLTVDQGVWEEQPDCNIRSLKVEFRALCWPRRAIGQWLTPQFVVTEYLWRDTILIKGKDNKVERIPNPEPPLKLADGTEVKMGYFLRDLKSRIVMQILTKQGAYKVDRLYFQPDPEGKYLYAPCSKSGDHNSLKTFSTTLYGRVCRLKLGGTNESWAELFSLHLQQNQRASLYYLDARKLGSENNFHDACERYELTRTRTRARHKGDR